MLTLVTYRRTAGAWLFAFGCALSVAGCTSDVAGPGDDGITSELEGVAAGECGVVVCESDDSASRVQEALHTLGEPCSADAECADGLFCRPMGTDIDAEARCLEAGVEYISKRFGGPTHLCGDLCDSDADCAEGHACQYLEASENGMCIAEGGPIIDIPYGDKTTDCAHPE